MRSRTGKRVLLTAVATMGIGGLLVGCAGGGSTGASSITVASWGGDTDNLIKEHVLPVYEQGFDDSAPNVALDSTNIDTRITKVMSQVDSEVGDYDIVMVQDWDVARLSSAGALEKLDYTKMSNAENILPVLQHDYCIPHFYSALSIIYDPEQVETPPTKWTDFWNPEYSDSVGVFTNQMNFFHWVAAAAAVGGDPGSEIDRGYSLVEDASEFVRPYSSNEQLGQALISGEVKLGLNTAARFAQYDEASGGRLEKVIPEEGTAAAVFYACITANASDKESSYEFLNALLNPEVQPQFAEGMGYAPSVSDAVIDPELAEVIALTPEEEERFYSLDSDYLGEYYEEHFERWNREVIG